MPPQADSAPQSKDGAGRASSLAGPALAVGAFAAGAAVALLAKRLVDARRKAAGAADELDPGGDRANEDLASVLRRAALDVAVLATGQAAERLQGDEAATSSR